MITFYKVFNPYTGLHTDAHNVEELKAELLKVAWETYMRFTDNQPFTVVTLNKDGSQVWRSPTGEELIQSDQFGPDDFNPNLPIMITALGDAE
jgi:hypothetical protein